MVRGTHNLFGDEADALVAVERQLEFLAHYEKFQRFIPSSLVEASLLDGQTGDNRVFRFKDLGDRELMLLPEVTGVARQWFREHGKALPKPVKLYYTARCYRYDRPQRGRYREFTQFGIEMMPSNGAGPAEILPRWLDYLGLFYEFRDGVDRGQAYYSRSGFEIWAAGMQIAGGGPYGEGAGFAIGIERLMIALEEQKVSGSVAQSGRAAGS
jgi:histidyl-tRNA synthetase